MRISDWSSDVCSSDLLNCAALAESLLETELFGHEAGAFTGAVKRRSGRFEIADGGSMFLDEIAAASQAVQEKLMRAIEYGTIERVGGNATQAGEVRVIGGTKEDLPEGAAGGRIQEGRGRRRERGGQRGEK